MVQIKPWDASVIAGPQRVTGVTAVQSGAGELARGMQAVGDMFYGFQDEVDTADAKVADSQLGKLIQDRLYAEGTGYMYAQGGDAVARRESLIQQIEKDREAILGKMSAPARARAELSMTSRLNQALEGVNRHAMTEGRGYANAASEARIGMFVSDAIYKPETTSIQMRAVETEIRELAARNGWPPEVAALKMKEAKTQAHSGTISRIANADPGAALDYLRRHKDDMTGEEVARLEGALAPEVKRARGRAAGQAALSGAQPVYQHNSVVEYNMGPRRPNAPSQQLTSMIGKAAENVLGPGARIVVTSGTEGDLPQFGSTRHKTGHAADVAIYTPDGRKLTAADPEFAAVAKAAASLGARGIGFGAEYMGGDHMHIDLVEAGAGQGNQWASGAAAISADLDAARKGYSSASAGGLAALLEIQDPLERKAAIEEYELRQTVADGERKARYEAATMAGWELVERGGSVENLTFEQKQTIGMSGLEKLRGIESKLKSGDKYVTDPAVYVQVSELAVTDPQGFLALDPLDVRPMLSDADFKAFVKTRTDLMQGGSAPTAPVDMGAARSVIGLEMQAAGIDEKKAAGARQRSDLEAKLLKWGTQYRQQNARPPSELEVRQFIRNGLVDVVLNPPGFGNEQSGPAVGITMGGKPVASGGQVSMSGVVALDDLLLSDLRIGGVKVPRGDMQAFIEGFTARYGSPPSPQDVMDGLIASGVYTNGGQ